MTFFPELPCAHGELLICVVTSAYRTWSFFCQEVLEFSYKSIMFWKHIYLSVCLSVCIYTHKHIYLIRCSLSHHKRQLRLYCHISPMWLCLLTFIIEYLCLLCKESKHKSELGKAAYLKLVVVTCVLGHFPIIFSQWYPIAEYASLEHIDHVVSALWFISIQHIAVQAAAAVLQRRLLLRQNLHLCIHIAHARLTLLYSRADLEIKWLFFFKLSFSNNSTGEHRFKSQSLCGTKGKLFSPFPFACGQPFLLPKGEWCRAHGNCLLQAI